MSIWRCLPDQQSGFFFSLSESLRIAETAHAHILVAVDEGRMIVASDYSGQHKEARHEAYSFIVTNDLALNEWLPRLVEFRERWLPDGRRISFKKLNEPVRWRALPAFLKTASKLKGNLITILIDRRVGSFMSGGPTATVAEYPDCFDPDAKLGTVEKMFRLAGFVALILGGLRREDQVSHWISDNDETLDSHDKREKFARLARYLTFGLTGWLRPADHLFATTGSPMAPDWSEDLAAVADLAAAAYCQLSSHLPAFMGCETWRVQCTTSPIQNQRAYAIGNWLAKGTGNLKHALLRLELDSIGEVRASAQAFVPE